MSLEEAQRVGAQFALDVEAVTPIPHGSVNSNFAVRLSDGSRMFMRVCEESSADAVRRQNALLAHLVAAGVPTPAPRARSDGAGTIAAHAGKPVSVFDFCEGGWICQQRVDEARLRRVGEVLASIHLAGEGYQDGPEDRFGVGQLRARLVDLQHRSLPGDVARDVVVLGSRLDAVWGRVGALPTDTIVHGDVFRDNVLWHDDGRLSAVLDFESAALGHPSFDLMVTMLAWCVGDSLEQRLARALVAGYQARRPLSADEIAACYDTARAAAVRFAITRITDYELRPQGVVVYKDYRRFMARLSAVEAVGPERFHAWLGATLPA